LRAEIAPELLHHPDHVPCGSGFLRTGTEPTSSGPAAGKADTTGIGGFLLVVVVGDVVVSMVPVPPASARVGSRTAAENPATARRTEAMRTRRLTCLRRRS